ncbi:MAG: DUF4386 domain-containing protein [Acidobacteriota bacterium]
MQTHDVPPVRKLALTAGLLYLAMIAGTGAAYYNTLTLITGDPQVVLAQLRESLPVFQFAILSFAAGLTAFVFLGLWLHRLFRPVNEAMATVLLVLVSVHAAISLAGIAPLMDALTLVRGPMLVDPGQLAGQVALSVLSFNTLWRVSFIFSGLWLFPLGWLVYRCGFLPRFVGIAAMVGSVSYVLSFAGWVMDPAYDTSLIGRIIGIVSGVPSLIGEMGTCLSLLITGLRRTARLQVPTP